MKVLLIVAHPNESSFNHAIAAKCSRVLAENGHEVIAHDLYRERFDPLPHTGEMTESRPRRWHRARPSGLGKAMAGEGAVSG